ncbi:GyrI-like domain-containing protein [Phytohabitans suffuscus]|uniref:DNA gyrase inhibitor n=1 Tax=Phytohabitans suffuscus TaxID=624315 RepID=A0A6F8YYU2_9ACTN|nr:GyrI-like domain-containing protein [Phytohabitans suffuscus]BCB91236.1 DNA gyrase inhibitor [Phytohabitans suffuscus]
MDLIKPPRVERRPAVAYVGIRVVTPFRGMLRVRDDLMADLVAWLEGHGAGGAGPLFFRLHVIDMDGPMDVEVGAVTREPVAGGDQVRAGTLPAGRYATLTYRNHSLRANKTLLEWVRANGVALDRRETSEGDAFGCRYEAYLTDPRTESRKTRWETELSMRVAD